MLLLQWETLQEGKQNLSTCILNMNEIQGPIYTTVKSVGKAGCMYLNVLRFWHSLSLYKPHQCTHACGDESVNCHKASQLFHHLFQWLFFAFKHNIAPSTDFQKMHVVDSLWQNSCWLRSPQGQSSRQGLISPSCWLLNQCLTLLLNIP